MDPAAEAAIRAGNDVFAADDRRVPQNAVGDELKLKPKQARFVQEYLIDLNAAQAAIRAGSFERGVDPVSRTHRHP